MQLKLLAETLEDVKQENGEEFWYARDIWKLLGYSSWQKFEPVLGRAMEACSNSGYDPDEQFNRTVKSSEMPNGGKREVSDYKLTRYACYLIAQNGDSKIPEIAFAQTYFAMQTRRQEVLEKRIEEIERLIYRKKLTETEKEFAKIAFEHGVDGKGIAEIRNAGDVALFQKSTRKMKEKLGVRSGKPLADVLHSVILKGKDFATGITTVNTQLKNLKGTQRVRNEHIANNDNVRKTLVDAGIKPEELPPEEDIAKIQSRLNKQKIVEPTQRKHIENQ